VPATRPTVSVRRISKDERRRQLIAATMRVLARKGYAETTLSEVAAEAGVSYGLVSFYFDSKESLLTQTLLSMSEEYRENWSDALARAGADPAERLWAMLGADFNDAICTRDHIACWCAFWGEVQSRPLYQQECASNDEFLITVLEGLCADVIRQGAYDLDPVHVARILRFASDGLWTDMLAMKAPYSRYEALATMRTCLAVYFPRHFSRTDLPAGSAVETGLDDAHA